MSRNNSRDGQTFCTLSVARLFKVVAFTWMLFGVHSRQKLRNFFLRKPKTFRPPFRPPFRPICYFLKSCCVSLQRCLLALAKPNKKFPVTEIVGVIKCRSAFTWRSCRYTHGYSELYRFHSVCLSVCLFLCVLY